MVVTVMALVWTALMWTMPAFIDVPMPALSAAAMALFATKLIKTLLLYPPKVGSGFKGAFIASIAGLALTHTVGKAVWTGLLTSNKPFLRTPKCADPASFTQVLREWCGRRRCCWPGWSSPWSPWALTGGSRTRRSACGW